MVKRPYHEIHRIHEGVVEKNCVRCEEWKVVSKEFYDPKNSYCIGCRRILAKIQTASGYVRESRRPVERTFDTTTLAELLGYKVQKPQNPPGSQ